jgi:hypothetical protein
MSRDKAQGAPPDWRRTYWQVCLPATGVLVTACLYALINGTLLANTAPPDPLDLKVRVFEKKTEDRKDDPKKANGTKATIPVWHEVGTVNAAAGKFEQRHRYLDVQARQLTYLTTWSVMNLLQGALAVVVLAVSAGTIRKYWRRGKDNQVLWVALLILLGSLGLLGLLQCTSVIDLTLSRSLYGVLNEEIRKATDLAGRAGFVTTLGDLSVALVIVVMPFSLCVLLHSSEKAEGRFDRLQLSMYCTALLLVVGAIQVSFQSRGPALFFDDHTSLEQIAQIALSRGLLVGAIFSIALAFVFLPAGPVLRGQESDRIEGNAIASKWNWFTELFAVFAPVAAALPVGKLFELLQ